MLQQQSFNGGTNLHAKQKSKPATMACSPRER